MTYNPYLLPPQGSGGGYMSPPGAVFGQRASSGVYSPAPGGVFGYGRAPQPGYNRFGGGNCNPCGDPCAPGQPSGDRLQDLLQTLRYGGRWPQMPLMNPCAEQGAAALVAAHAQRHADDLTHYYGVDSGPALIGIGLTAQITVIPQKRHIPEKLSLTEAMASNFLITGIFAGVEPVLATTGPISAAIFIQDSTAPAFKSVIMDVGMQFTVGVTNISGAPARFTSTVMGKPVPPGL